MGLCAAKPAQVASATPEGRVGEGSGIAGGGTGRRDGMGTGGCIWGLGWEVRHAWNLGIEGQPCGYREASGRAGAGPALRLALCE